MRSSSVVLVLCGFVSALAATPCLAAQPSAEASPMGVDVAFPAVVNVTARPLTPFNAPADEYFGRLKLSNLGVRNIIHALAVEGTSPLALPLERTRIMGVHTAILEWGDAYPRDPWLKHSVLNFADVLVSKHDSDTDMIAFDLLLQASQRFRNTPFAKTALARAGAIRPTDTIDWNVVPIDMPTLSEVAELHT